MLAVSARPRPSAPVVIVVLATKKFAELVLSRLIVRAVDSVVNDQAMTRSLSLSVAPLIARYAPFRAVTVGRISPDRRASSVASCVGVSTGAANADSTGA